MRGCARLLALLVAGGLLLGGCSQGARVAARVNGPDEQATLQTGAAPAATPGEAAASPPAAPPAAGPAAGIAAASPPTAISGGATPPAPAQQAAAAAGRPGGTVTITWGPKHYVNAAFRLTGMAPSKTYPVGLFAAPCGVQPATLLDGFEGIDSLASGESRQAAVYSDQPMDRGVPAGVSLRLGPPVPLDTENSADAVAGVSCADIGRPVQQVSTPVTFMAR